MRKARNKFLGFCMATALAASLAPAEEAGTGDRRAEDLYREAFAISERLPRDADEFVREATRESIAELERALDLTREAAVAESVDCGIDWLMEGEAGMNFKLPGKARNFARLGVRYHAEKIKRGQSDRFVADMVALLRMGHHLSEGQPLIFYLTAVATEGLVKAAIAEHARSLPADVLAEMRRSLEDLSGGPSLAEVLDIDAAVTLAHFWNVFAGTVDLGADAPPALLQRVEFKRPLRIAGFEPRGPTSGKISFEDISTGKTIQLGPGQKEDGIEFVWLDRKVRRAMIRTEEAAGVVELSREKLHPIDPKTAWARIAYLFWFIEALGAQTFSKGESASDSDVTAVIQEKLRFFKEEADDDPLLAFRAMVDLYASDRKSVRTLATQSFEALRSPEDTFPEFPFFWSRRDASRAFKMRQLELREKANMALLLAGLSHLENRSAPPNVCPVTGERIQLFRQGDILVLQSSFPETRAPTRRNHKLGQPLRLEFPPTAH